MAEKITDYTAKSQDFIDTDLFDVSKHVTQTSGVLVVGKRYTILDFNVGDNFTNVASVVSGTINTTGCVFDAIGTTPTTYSNGSTLAHYETQSYTYEDLKTGLSGNPTIYAALLSQTGTDAPTASVDRNTLANSPTISRDSLGYYLIESPDFVKGKTHVYIGNGSSIGVETSACLVTTGTIEVSTFAYMSQTVGSNVGVQNVEGLGYLDDTPILIVVYP